MDKFDNSILQERINKKANQIRQRLFSMERDCNRIILEGISGLGVETIIEKIKYNSVLLDSDFFEYSKLKEKLLNIEHGQSF